MRNRKVNQKKSKKLFKHTAANEGASSVNSRPRTPRTGNRM